MKIFTLEIPRFFYVDFLESLQKHISQVSSWNQDFWKGKSLFTPNPEICLKTLEDQEFLEILQNADYLTSDGIGLYLAYQIGDSRLWKIGKLILLPYYIFNILFRKKHLYKIYGDRICGSDLTQDLIDFSQKNHIKIAILDPYFPQDRAKCESQKYFRENIMRKFPELDFDFYVYKPEDKENILKDIQNSEAKILFSTLGMKKQEQSVLEFLEQCPNLRLGLGVGSSFDYFTGFQKRAPKIFRDLGFEWLYRIFTSPNKLKRIVRIYQALVIFPIKVIFYK